MWLGVIVDVDNVLVIELVFVTDGVNADDVPIIQHSNNNDT